MGHQGGGSGECGGGRSSFRVRSCLWGLQQHDPHELGDVGVPELRQETRLLHEVFHADVGHPGLGGACPALIFEAAELLYRDRSTPVEASADICEGPRPNPLLYSTARCGLMRRSTSSRRTKAQRGAFTVSSEGSMMARESASLPSKLPEKRSGGLRLDLSALIPIIVDRLDALESLR